MEENALDPEHLVLFSCILVGMLTKYNLLPSSSEYTRVKLHLLILQGRITEFSVKETLPISVVKAEEVVTLTACPLPARSGQWLSTATDFLGMKR